MVCKHLIFGMFWSLHKSVREIQIHSLILIWFLLPIPTCWLAHYFTILLKMETLPKYWHIVNSCSSLLDLIAPILDLSSVQISCPNIFWNLSSSLLELLQPFLVQSLKTIQMCLELISLYIVQSYWLKHHKSHLDPVSVWFSSPLSSHFCSYINGSQLFCMVPYSIL